MELFSVITDAIEEGAYNDWLCSQKVSATVQEFDHDNNKSFGPVYTDLRIKRCGNHYEYAYVTTTPRNSHFLWPKQNELLKPGEHILYENAFLHHKYYKVTIC